MSDFDEQRETAGQIAREQRMEDLLKRHRPNALTVRELAWRALKQTRNPDYVAARYGYPVEKMRQALRKIESDESESKEDSR